jgi:hypothetical protein
MIKGSKQRWEHWRTAMKEWEPQKGGDRKEAIPVSVGDVDYVPHIMCPT